MELKGVSDMYKGHACVRVVPDAKISPQFSGSNEQPPA